MTTSPLTAAPRSSNVPWVSIGLLFGAPLTVALLTLIGGLLGDRLWLVYVSIAASLVTVPCWIAALVLLVVRLRDQRTTA